MTTGDTVASKRNISAYLGLCGHSLWQTTFYHKLEPGGLSVMGAKTRFLPCAATAYGCKALFCQQNSVFRESVKVHGVVSTIGCHQAVVHGHA